MSAGTVHIVRHGRGEAEVHAPFEARDIIKESLPRTWRRWDVDGKRWLVIADAVDDLTEALERALYLVVIRDAPGAGHQNRAAKNTTWADAMFAALSPALADRAHKALARVLHPDHGGDLGAMKALNAARDTARRGTP